VKVILLQQPSCTFLRPGKTVQCPKGKRKIHKRKGGGEIFRFFFNELKYSVDDADDFWIIRTSQYFCGNQDLHTCFGVSADGAPPSKKTCYGSRSSRRIEAAQAYGALAFTLLR